LEKRAALFPNPGKIASPIYAAGSSPLTVLSGPRYPAAIVVKTKPELVSLWQRDEVQHER
jgi:hypothetical protein